MPTHQSRGYRDAIQAGTHQQRTDRALQARTESELAGLLADLPPSGPGQVQTARSWTGSRRSSWPAVPIAVIVVAAAALLTTGHGHGGLPVLVPVLLVILLARRFTRRRRGPRN